MTCCDWKCGKTEMYIFLNAPVFLLYCIQSIWEDRLLNSFQSSALSFITYIFYTASYNMQLVPSISDIRFNFFLAKEQQIEERSSSSIFILTQKAELDEMPLRILPSVLILAAWGLVFSVNYKLHSIAEG